MTPPSAPTHGARQHLPALLALAATVAAWSLVPLILRHFAREAILDAWTINGIRYFLTMLFWLPFVVRLYPRIPAGRNIWKDAAVPACCHMVGQTAWSLAPYYNEAGVMNFVSRISFLFMIILGFLLLREERAIARSRLFWFGAAGTVIGLVAMFSSGLKIQNTSATGMTLMLTTSLCWALYGVQVKKRMQGYPARLGFGVVSILVAPVLLVVMFLLGDVRQALSLTALQWSMVVLSAWVGIALGHVLYYQAVRDLGPVVSEGALAAIPFITAISAHLVLGERLVVAQWIGGTILVAASLALLAARLRGTHPPARAQLDPQQD